MCPYSFKEKLFILWANLVDLGIHTALNNLKKKTKSTKQALDELKKSLFRQSEDHWEGLCRALKRLK